MHNFPKTTKVEQGDLQMTYSEFLSFPLLPRESVVNFDLYQQRNSVAYLFMMYKHLQISPH